MDSLKRSIILITALLLAVAQGAWAQVVVSSESELNTAVGTDNVTSIVLGADILLESYLNINGKTVTIDLNGHMLYRQIIGGYLSDGHVIYVHNYATLNLVNSTGTGSIKGGRANNGGGINIGPLCTVNASNVTFQDNTAGEHGGAIWNSGTLTATNCTFTNNSAGDVGAVYNAVVENTYFGAATFTGCTFTGNSSSTSAGALANATGNTSMTLEGCTITGNRAQTNGGGIWNGGTLTITGNTSIIDNDCPGGYNGGGIYQLNGTLNISGNLVVKGNGSGNRRNNIYLAPGQVVTVAGTFASGAEIWLTNAPDNLYFTSSYSTCSESNPNRVFFYDDEDYRFTIFEGEMIRYEIVLHDDVPYLNDEGEIAIQYGCGRTSLITDRTGVAIADGWYVVDQNTTFENRLNISGIVHLLLRDGVTLDAKEGICVPSGSTFHVWGQSNGSGMGELISDARSLPGYAGIGGDRQQSSGTLHFHGGAVNAFGGQGRGFGGAGIGSGSGCDSKPIYIYGGSVFGSAIDDNVDGSGRGAGIGSGLDGLCGDITINGGIVQAHAGSGAGIGSGYDGRMHITVDHTYDVWSTITINGGTVIAISTTGAGIGGGAAQNATQGMSGSIYINGGSVTAWSSNAESAEGTASQAIGHGELIRNANVYGQGGRFLYSGAKVVVDSGSQLVTLQGEDRFNYDENGKFMGLENNRYKWVEISPCDHPNGLPCVYCGLNDTETLSLADASNNFTALRDYNGHLLHATLSGRTFWKDGSWNTLCLPFALESFIHTPLFGATVVELTGASFTNGVLTLTFGNIVSAIEAGKPYLVKWDSGENITNPVFQNVKINNYPVNSKVGDVTFAGTYGPVDVYDEYHTKLYLGADNKLYYATSALNVNSFRGYFVLGENLQPNAVSSLVMDFGEEPVGELNVVEE